MIRQSICVLAVFHLFIADLAAQSVDESRVAELEAQLQAAQASLNILAETIEVLAIEITEIKAGSVGEGGSYSERILVTDLGHDERAEELTPRPELFVQLRYNANPIDEAADEDAVDNFGISRVELRWSGRVSDKVGVGYEMQFHPAPDGAAEELVNDAYVEYYPNDVITVRAGQFIKPFGFDIQHSSSDRESPERGMFAGYFFPGQRDRGLMVAADLGAAGEWAENLSLYAGIFNGNRFFDDNNPQLNYNLRLRKVFDHIPLALGASYQRGTQILPPGMSGNDDENAYGIDVQYVINRLGIRGEYVKGNTPSTLLALEPEFAPGFVPGDKSSGVAAFFNYNLTANDDIYWRWDKFKNDPVTTGNIRAFNLGYLRQIGPNSRIGIDYQRKSNVTYNDDELNNALSIIWNVAY
jgi:hypothetical protein